MGYHELTGSKVTLKKPLLVLKKLQLDEFSGKATELEVVGNIRTKILFKTRPKPLISGTNLSLMLLILLSETFGLICLSHFFFFCFRNKLGCKSDTFRLLLISCC